MKKHRLLAMMLALMFILAEISDGTETTGKDDETVTMATLPKELAQIPEDYFEESGYPGTLVELEYDTYESMTYEEQKQVLHKRAIVYLPYGYSEKEKYNVFYLMHGGWSDETTYLGTPDRPAVFKNVLDNGIADGTIQSMIVVCPTYNNTSPDDSGDYSLAIRLTENYHRELVHDLIPAVEVRYFIPSSGNLTSDEEYMASMVTDSGHTWSDFFIFAASGTDDFAYSSFKYQIEAMAAVEMEYFYNGLCWIWQS